MISRFYYSLTKEQPQEVMLVPMNELGMQMGEHGIIMTFDRYYPITKEYGINWLITELTGYNHGEVDTDITKKLLEHIWLNLYNKNVAYLDIKHQRWEQPEKPYSGDDYTEMCQDLGNEIWSIYRDTKDRYEKLIGIYEDELDNLMKPMESASETRFNDTPQNAVVSPEAFAADNYTTTITNTKASTDLTSKMNRIDEVQRLLKNLYSDWAFEFNKLICED